MEQFDLKKVKVHRTLEGTIFETVAAVILVITWAIAIATHQMDLDVVKGSFMGVIFGTIAVVVSLTLGTGYHLCILYTHQKILMK